MLRSRIIGTGHFLPSRVLTNHDLEQMMDTTDAWIRQRTGIMERRTAEDGEGSADLAIPAARKALEAAGVTGPDIDLIIVGTCTPDYVFPSSACIVQEAIGAVNAVAFDINAACSGFIYGLSVVDTMLRSGQYKTALLIGAERVCNRLNWSVRDTAVLFGDGAGAVILRAEEGDTGILDCFLGSDGSQAHLLRWKAGGSKYWRSDADMNADEWNMEMKGQELFKRAVVEFARAIQKTIDSGDANLEDIDLLIPHQANIRIIRAAADRVGIPHDKCLTNLDRVGNTMAASIPIALDEAMRCGRIKQGSLIMLAAFGAGLTWGSVLIRL